MTYLAVPGRVTELATTHTLLVEVYSDCDQFAQWRVKLRGSLPTTLHCTNDQFARALWSVGLEALRAEIALGGDPPEVIDVDQAELDRRLEGAPGPRAGESPSAEAPAASALLRLVRPGDERQPPTELLPDVGEVSWSVPRAWIPLENEHDYLKWRERLYSNTPAGTRIHLGPPDRYPCRATIVEGGPFGQNRIYTAVYAPVESAHT